MADINFNHHEKEQDYLGEATPQPEDAELVDTMTDLIELLFFAYRDFISDPDEILAEFDFGRAHHRVIHFVNRNPGIRVNELLDILKITKQSLGRVLKQLVDTGFIDQKPGPLDRRQRLLFATEKGQDLARRLSHPQAERLQAALDRMPEENQKTIRRFLFHVISEEERGKVAMLTGTQDYT